MSGRLLTDDELAETLRITLDEVHKYRRKRGWPCVKFGRSEYRFTPEQVDQIVAMHSHGAARPLASAPTIAGQTAKSKARAS